jgi:peptidoglycan/xylan/chitin deacetylase (PgdA/CDA1 family)
VRWKGRIGNVFASIAYGAGLHRSLLRDRAVVVVFHRVDDRYPENAISMPVARFGAMCRFFARHFQVIRLGELVTLLEQGKPLEGQLVITFDDGYRDNHRTAAPILEQLKLPACFFITTGFIESGEVPRWDRKAGIVSEWMTWDDVRDLHRRGFEIGAHTVTHADLGQVSGEEARREIVDSKRALETRLGSPVTLFAYPFGREAQITDANRALVAAAGFRSCPSAFGGLVRTGDDPLQFRRLPVTQWYRSSHELGLEVLRASRANAGARRMKEGG